MPQVIVGRRLVRREQLPVSDLTAAEVARRLGWKRDRVHAALGRGVFPNAYQLARRREWRIPESDLEGL